MSGSGRRRSGIRRLDPTGRQSGVATEHARRYGEAPPWSGVRPAATSGEDEGIVSSVQGDSVPIITSPQDFNVDDLYVDLRHVIDRPLFLKCEGFNFAGSVKLKAAAAMVEAAEREGVLAPGTTIVESSSGNLGIALSLIAA